MLMLTERLQDVVVWPSENRRSGASDHQKKNKKKPQGHWTPPFFPLLSGCKIHYGHSRCEPKWCTFLKLVIYLTIDVFVAICPPPPHPLCTLLLVIT